MKILVDTNVVVRFMARADVGHQTAVDAVKTLGNEGHELCLVPQNLYEFWVVATRPAEQNGLGMSPAAAHSDLVQLQEFFSLLRDERSIYEPWQGLVLQYQVRGRRGHDARLVAAMQRHRLTHLLTINTADFKRYHGISLLTPADVLAGKVS
jgi:predicted nucleic acid-binding protein